MQYAQTVHIGSFYEAFCADINVLFQANVSIRQYIKCISMIDDVKVIICVTMIEVTPFCYG